VQVNWKIDGLFLKKEWARCVKLRPLCYIYDRVSHKNHATELTKPLVLVLPYSRGLFAFFSLRCKEEATIVVFKRDSIIRWQRRRNVRRARRE
jgi:hypothetical protein